MENKILSNDEINSLMKKGYRKLKPHYCHFRFHPVPDVALDCFQRSSIAYQHNKDYEHQVLALNEAIKVAHNLHQYNDEAKAYYDKAIAYTMLMIQSKNKDDDYKKIEDAMNKSSQSYRIAKMTDNSITIYSDIVKDVFIPNHLNQYGCVLLLKGLDNSVEFIFDSETNSIDIFNRALLVYINAAIEEEKYNDIIDISMKFYKELTTHSNSDKQKIKSLIVIISLVRVLIQSYDEIDQFINEIDSTVFYDEIDKVNAIVYAFKNIVIDSFEKTIKKFDIYNIPSKLDMKIRNSFASISNIGSNISETKEKEILITLKEHAENDTGVINNIYNN